VGEIRRADKRHGGRADANVMALPWRAATVPPWREHFTERHSDSSENIFRKAEQSGVNTSLSNEPEREI